MGAHTLCTEEENITMGKKVTMNHQVFSFPRKISIHPFLLHHPFTVLYVYNHHLALQALLIKKGGNFLIGVVLGSPKRPADFNNVSNWVCKQWLCSAQYVVPVQQRCQCHTVYAALCQFNRFNFVLQVRFKALLSRDHKAVFSEFMI